MLSSTIQAIAADASLGVVATVDSDHRVGVYCWITRRKLHSFQLQNAKSSSRHHICVCRCGLIGVSTDENDFSEIGLFDFYGKNFGTAKVTGRVLKMMSTMTEHFESYVVVGTSWNILFVLSCNGLKLVKKNGEPVSGEFFSTVGSQRQLLTVKLSKPFRSLSVLNY